MPSIYFTSIAEANLLLGDDSFALLVGLTLYQQIPTEKAFAGPYELKQRLGGEFTAESIAVMNSEELEAVFREKPALHRFPANMAKRVQSVATFIVEEYNGVTADIWTGVANADRLMKRLVAIPGFGEYKARLTIGTLAKHYGVKPRGYTKYLPDWPSIVDITRPEDLAELKVRKKLWKSQKAN
ncbi:MAG: Fe-S cluster assembly protein HesB [Acidobacteria bacterium]|nr:Fe-S cluster assembly protein HesB [Acidobacteriota bacterium]